MSCHDRRERAFPPRNLRALAYFKKLSYIEACDQIPHDVACTKSECNAEGEGGTSVAPSNLAGSASVFPQTSAARRTQSGTFSKSSAHRHQWHNKEASQWKGNKRGSEIRS